MAYFDYSLPTVPDPTQGIKAVGDALSEVMKRKQQQKQFDAEMAQKTAHETRLFKQNEANIKHQTAALDERTNRDRVRFMMEQDANLAKGMEGVRTAPNAQTAKARAAALRRYDWQGNEIGVGQLTPGELPPDVGPEPTVSPEPQMGPEMQEAVPDMLQMMPGAPPELAAMLRGRAPKAALTQPMEGPIPTAEEARRGAMARVPVKAGMFGAVGSVPPDAEQQQSPEEEARLADVERERVGMEASQRSFNPEFAAYQADERAMRERLGAAAGAQTAFDEKTDAYEKEISAFPGKQRQYQADLRRGEGKRPYTLTVGANDPGITFDFDTQLHAAANDAADRFLETIPITVDAPTRQAAQLVAGYIKSQQIKPHEAGAMLQKVIAEGGAEAGKNRRADADNVTQLEYGRIMANRPRASLVIGQENVNMRKMEQFQKDAERIGTRYGVKLDIAGLKQLDDGIAGLGSGNQALERGIVFQIARSMQGVGPLTQQDIDQIRTDISGKLGTLESVIERYNTGGLGASDKKVFFEAIRVRRKALGARMQAARGLADKKFLSPTSVYRGFVPDEHIVDEMDAMFPGTQSTIDVTQLPPRGAAPPEVAAGRRGKTKVSVTGTPDPVEAALKLLTGGQQAAGAKK